MQHAFIDHWYIFQTTSGNLCINAKTVRGHPKIDDKTDSRYGIITSNVMSISEDGTYAATRNTEYKLGPNMLPGGLSLADAVGILSIKQLAEKQKKRKLIANIAQCKRCGDIIESRHRHDFVWCSCGSLAVDGGLDYSKRSCESRDGYVELSKYV